MNKYVAVPLAAVAVVALGATGAQAAKQIGSADIKDNSVQSVDIKDGTIRTKDLQAGTFNALKGKTGAKGATGAQGPQGATGSDGATGPAGPAGPAGADGHNGSDGVDGHNGTNGLVEAYYSIAKYDSGDTNAGAIATVACKAQTDVAISGGVQVLGLDAGANSRNTPVSSSFPGRMDWSTNSPKADRLDGWIVQFGGNAGATSDKAPEKVNVWALCVPGASISSEVTFTQSAG